MSDIKPSTRTPELTDPDWLPTDTEELDILSSAERRVAWEKAMASRGVMILTLGLSPGEEQAQIDAWARNEMSLEPVAINR
jgi:hypothetical protein